MSEADTYNPYAPPATDVGSGRVDTGLKRRGLVAMFFLVICTLGIYYPVWFFRRRPGLNRLDSPRKLALWPLLVFATYFAFEIVLAVITGEQTPEQAFGSEVALMFSLVQLAVGIMMIIQCFVIKDIIEDHAQAPADAEATGMFRPQVKLSGLMTFFFSIFHLQYAINKYVVDGRS
jgi:hypothetical protein